MDSLVQSIFTEKPNDLFIYLERLLNKKHVHSVALDLIDEEIINEIKNIFINCENTRVYFGKTLRDIKVVIKDDKQRKHDIYLQYTAPRKIIVSNVKLPHSSIQSREYESLKEIIDTFSQYVNDLAGYFHELENIDEFCKIMEPINASFKDDYRRIYLDERNWLHVEVTHEGLATNIYLVGQSEYWHNRLQSGLLSWDHDKNIVDNIMTIFELNQMPQPDSKITERSKMHTEDESMVDTVVCGICLCADLPEAPGMPLPLCQNSTCGVYYHRNCLYQWLVACAGSRAPAFGVANGACPTCLQPITCNEKDK